MVSISSASDFLSFGENVNNGTNYLSTTVFLNSDLSLSGNSMDPIGASTLDHFRGVFDGQGHIISDLKMNYSSLRYIGLFGSTVGATIRNVVLDSSCSITTTYGESDLYMGGILGYCNSCYGQCIIENSVNMADVIYNGNALSHNDLDIGGLAGDLYSYTYDIYVKNCVNYGSVICSGNIYRSNIGGIAGTISSDSSNHHVLIYNSINYGTIMYSGTEHYIGGIAGHNYHAYVENCVSAGKITASTGESPASGQIGSFMGYVESDTKIKYCYYTSDVNASKLYAYANSAPDTTGSPDSPYAISQTLVDNLNDYATSNSWNKWLLNTNNKDVTFKTSGNTELSLSSSLIIFPNLNSDTRGFIGWFSDSSLTTLFTSSSVSSSTTLYGRWDKYIVVFDANGGKVSKDSMYVDYNSKYGELPTPTKVNCTFSGWFTERDGGSKITASTVFTSLSDVVIYAHWNDPNKNYVGILCPLVLLAALLV